MRRRWAGLLSVMALALASAFAWHSGVASSRAPSSRASIERGRSIYQTGQALDGRPVVAVAQGDVSLSGVDAACVRCHQKSGFGSSEGAIRSPPIVASILFSPESPSPLERTGDAAPASRRIAYTEASLEQAIARGIDASGNALSPTMPRYRLEARDLEDVVRYLASLSAAPSAGVTETELRLATVVSATVPAAPRAALAATLAAYVDAKNAGTRLEAKRARHAPWTHLNEYTAYRKWSLTVWELTGPKDSWGDQLRKYQQQNPVFAIVSGLVDDSFAPIGAFCQELAVPCVFPITPVTGTDEPGFYTFHFSRGVALDADIALHELLTSSPPVGDVLQIYEATPRGVAAAAALRRALDTNAHDAPSPLRLEELPLPSSPCRAPLELPERFEKPTAIVAWLDADALACLRGAWSAESSPAKLLVSSRFAERPAAWFAERFGDVSCSLIQPHDATAQANDARRFGAWARSRGLDVSHPQIQLQAYFAATLLGDALMHVRQHLVVEYVLETIEHAAYRALITAGLPRLSLAPGQRFASKGAYVTRLEPGGSPSTAEWLVP